MAESLDVEALARLSGVALEDLERFRERGLLDLDGDGRLDELDVLRLRVILHYRALGRDVDEIVRALREGRTSIPFASLLWAAPADMVSAHDAAAATGLSLDSVELLFRAVGLGGSIPRDELRFLHAVKALVDGGIPLKMVLDVARVYGDTLRRLAQAEVRLVSEFLSEARSSSLLKEPAQAERLEALQEELVPLLEPLLLTIHRRQLLRASMQEALAALEAAERGDDALQATIGFFDLASFTTLAQIHGDEGAADILERFDELVRRLVDEHHGSFVKQIGDEFMVAFFDPTDGVRFAVALDLAAAREPNFPALRSGLHSGPVLYRMGDYVGTTVNLAARITALARPGEIILTRPVAEAAAAAGVPVSWAGARDVQGFPDPIELWRVEKGGAEIERDPVCGMALQTEVVARLRHDGVSYGFCSAECVRRFLEDPDRYATPA